MNTNLLVLANQLNDQDLITRLQQLGRGERRSMIELVAHLSALSARPSLQAELGYGSLYSFCTQALHICFPVSRRLNGFFSG